MYAVQKRPVLDIAESLVTMVATVRTADTASDTMLLPAVATVASSPNASVIMLLAASLATAPDASVATMQVLTTVLVLALTVTVMDAASASTTGSRASYGDSADYSSVAGGYGGYVSSCGLGLSHSVGAG